MTSSEDIWSRWLRDRRYGDSVQHMNAIMERLCCVRNQVLENANLSDGETLLDVGCGEGLIAFGALEQVPTSRVIFSDISQNLLDHAQQSAAEMGLLERCTFVSASAENLAQIGDQTVDVVTTRSVLIYVCNKEQAFNEFYRVLKPGGRISLFEPINRFCRSEPSQLFRGFDVSAIVPIADKVKAAYTELQPFDSDPMFDFCEQDLVNFADRAGFSQISMAVQFNIRPRTKQEQIEWDAFLHCPPNPKVPSLFEVIKEKLTSSEIEWLLAHMRPQVERHRGKERSAVAYVQARKEG